MYLLILIFSLAMAIVGGICLANANGNHSLRTIGTALLAAGAIVGVIDFVIFTAEKLENQKCREMRLLGEAEGPCEEPSFTEF